MYSKACVSKTDTDLSDTQRKRHLNIADQARTTTKTLQKVFQDLHRTRHIHREFVHSHRSTHALEEQLYHPKSPDYWPTDEPEQAAPDPCDPESDATATTEQKKRKKHEE